MCFSAEASFTASAMLGGISYFTLKSAHPKSLKLLAAVPLFFAIQQFTEGMLWLHFRGDITNPTSYWLSQHIYMFFAYLFWPVFFPLSLFVAEQDSFRKVLIGVCMAAGIFWIGLMFSLFPETPIQPGVIHQSIQYVGEDNLPKKLFYGAIIIIPCFLSTLRGIGYFGLLVFVSYGISELFYQYAFTSVWCFFAALISSVLYKIVKMNVPQEDSAYAKVNVQENDSILKK